MIVHIALYKWRESTTSAEIDEAIRQVRALKTKVPGLVDIRCGANFSRWNEGYTHAFVVLAQDRAALDSYRNHPDHQTVAKRIETMDAGSIGVDFED